MVPVLSVQIIETEPRVSTAFNFLAKILSFKSRFIPKDKATEIAAGSPSGTTDTERAKAKRKF